MIWPDPGLELACLVYATPVVIVNMWEYFGPEIIENLTDED